MRVILSGGGTGGHIYPALALRDNILRHYPAAEFLYIGTERGLESKIVPAAGLDFKTIRIQGLRRSLSLDNLKTMYYLLESSRKAKRLILDFKPDVVIGTGGYVCAPVLFAASRLNIPTIIHEQNSVAGITNKFLSRFVDKICICFDSVKHDFKNYADKIVFTGNPRAQEVALITEKADLRQYQLRNDKPTVLIFGGSRGAKKINETVMAAVPDFLKRDYQVLIATGDDYYNEFKTVFTNMESWENISVVPYIANMPELFNTIDLVVCRSGATTLTEIQAMGIASILIPSPNVTNNHQQRNAESLTINNAAEMILENELSVEKFIAAIDHLMMDDSARLEMAKAAKKMGIPDASDRIVHVIEHLI